MPLFGNTFSPKKTPPRKSASLSNLHSLDRSTREVELGLDYGTPTMNLAGQSLKFENGQWIAETGISGGVDRREAQRLRRRNQQLEEENNLLRLKVDILLDMPQNHEPDLPHSAKMELKKDNHHAMEPRVITTESGRIASSIHVESEPPLDIEVQWTQPIQCPHRRDGIGLGKVDMVADGYGERQEEMRGGGVFGIWSCPGWCFRGNHRTL
ncbi:protein chibby homolog 1 isoform X1 [Dasypus novemcinctus]|uniref:protein chibby homolog 1 isoform X1 n=1 Tax=Dasypus novemcinctus TaxID=9361 RepID=UPI0039C93BD3